MPDIPEQTQDRSLWSSILSFFRTPSRQRNTRKIICTDIGFTMYSDSDPIWSICWEDVTGVIAFKRDLYTTDQICLGFRILDNQSEIWSIDEDTDGYKSVQGDIAKLTQNAWPEKWDDVASPAFETCWTHIWIADGSTQVVHSDETRYIR